MPSIPTITVLSSSATARRAAEPLRAGAFALAIVAFELFLAKAIVGPEISRFVFLFLGLFALALVFRFPMPTALLFLALTDFIFHSTMFARDVGALSVRPHELALACLLAVALVRPRRETWGGAPGAALAAFLGLVGVSAALAVSAGETSLSDAFNWARPLGLLTFFYVVVRLFPEPRDRRLLLTAVAVLAAVSGVVAVAIALGAGLDSALRAPGDQAIRSQEGLGALERVRLSGLSAGYAIFWFAVVQIAARQGRSRAVWVLLLAGIALGIAVSFNRNMWLGLAIGALLMAVLGGTMVRNRLAVGSAIAVAGLVVLMAFGSSTTNEAVVQPILKRGSTLLSPGKTARESSLQDRAAETEAAWETAREHLLLGVGAGAPFGAYLLEPITSGSVFPAVATTPQLFLHNQYVYLVLIAGVPGLIAFLVFLGLPVLHSVRRAPRDPAIAACGVGILLIMISAVVAIYFTTDDWTPLLALLAGAIVADHEGAAPAGEPSGLSP